MRHQVEVYTNHATYGPVVEKRIALVADLNSMRYAGGAAVKGTGDYAHSYYGSADNATKFMHDVDRLGFECAAREVPA